MSRTVTRPPDDPKMWRRLVARTHPDSGGDHELFIWTTTVRDVVCKSSLRAGASPEPPVNPSRRREASTDDRPRVPYQPGLSFTALTGEALRRASVDDEYGRILALLKDCWLVEDLAHEQQRGASYKRLAAIAHAWGMTKAERIGWYRVAEDLPLSDRHAGHILARLKRRAA
jgi:hypothetical protein